MEQVVAVIGGGLSGVLVTRELLTTPGRSVVLVDPSARPGRGLAYGAAEPWHLLNSPVKAMSADPDRPDAFLAWCRAQDPRVGPDDFVSRAWYGEYLSEVLRGLDGSRLAVHRGRVSRIFEGSEKLTVLLGDGVVIPADQVVLAVGNGRSALMRRPGVVDPWAPGALAALPPGPVLLVGTGLTAVDVVLTLARLGRREIVALSRHGLLPQAHRTPAPPIPSRPVGGLTQLVRAIRRSASADWRPVLDGLRPHWDELWRGLTPAEQDRFLRHLARYWEVHRHRMAPPVAAEIDRLRADGVLTIRKGTYSDEIAAEYAAVVDCTGPGRLTDSDPLVRVLVAEGLARSGPHGLGLDVTPEGRLVGRGGRTEPAMWTLGPARRGVLWETTAAPEIRAQARQVAAAISRRRGSVLAGALGRGVGPDGARGSR
ncbi:FAD/NAD(P)-binding protein [Hamadaea tsunoensis]|uniref:FAD/NAD(P)-binding protein n=1 Tax=Hamadaea tsunoensis TaxID=53368 RepID=UPI0003F670B6|nr:FAD/NAD(P)-binding protein [Hamadaea tsunoensis]